MNTTPHTVRPHPAGRDSAGPHTITIAKNTASVVTAELCIATYPGEFTNHGEATAYAESYALMFPWGWTCSCGLAANGCRTAAEAAFNAPDEHNHLMNDPSTVVVLVIDDTQAGGGSA